MKKKKNTFNQDRKRFKRLEKLKRETTETNTSKGHPNSHPHDSVVGVCASVMGAGEENEINLSKNK